MPALTVQNAEIKTASVEVNTLTVSGKQVTLSVFRQIKEEVLVNHDGTLNGNAWGTVNYHPDKCADDRPHWHIVWQKGSELRRSSVHTEVGNPAFWCVSGDLFLEAHVRTVLSESTSRFWNGKIPDDPGFLAGEGMIEVNGLKVYLRSTEQTRKAIAAKRNSWGDNLENAIADMVSTPVEMAYGALVSQVELEKKRRQRQVDLRRSLADLPHLFIAV